MFAQHLNNKVTTFLIMSNIPEIKKQLDEIRPKVSGDDRRDAAYELKVHIETVNRYMRGEVSKEPFGLDLLSFLKARIEKREKALA